MRFFHIFKYLCMQQKILLMRLINVRRLKPYGFASILRLFFTEHSKKKDNNYGQYGQRQR